jgi:IS1 family transposase
VYKKEKHCNPTEPAAAKQGDNWDHVALDPEHRLVVSVVPGKRTAEKVEMLVEDFKKRTGGRPMNLITTDEYKPYRGAILKAYGEKVVPERTGKPGRPQRPYYTPSPKLKYATVHKMREKGRVVKIDLRVIFGTVAAVAAALKLSKVSNKINTAFVERQNGTDRNRNGRKVRKTYCFSKDWDTHNAVTYFTLYTYNFCWPVRTLRRRSPDGEWLPRTPAMAAGLTDHVWSLREWLTLPAVQYG